MHLFKFNFPRFEGVLPPGVQPLDDILQEVFVLAKQSAQTRSSATCWKLAREKLHNDVFVQKTKHHL